MHNFLKIAFFLLFSVFLIGLAVIVIPVLAIVLFFYSVFGRKSLKGTFVQFRSSDFYRHCRGAGSVFQHNSRGGTPPPDDTVCDVECTVVSSTPLDSPRDKKEQ